MPTFTGPAEAVWTSDQALLWMLRHDLALCLEASRDRGSGREHWLPYRLQSGEDGWGENPKALAVEGELLEAIRAARLCVMDEGEKVEGAFLLRCQWHLVMVDDAPSMDLRQTFDLKPAPNGPFQMRRQAEQISPEFLSAEVREAFPLKPRGDLKAVGKITVVATEMPAPPQEIAAPPPQLTRTESAIEQAIQAIWQGHLPTPMRASDRNEQIGAWILGKGIRPTKPDRKSITEYIKKRNGIRNLGNFREFQGTPQTSSNNLKI